MDKNDANVQSTGESKLLTNQHCFYHYTTFYFILQYVLFYIQLMSTKKQISSLCKLYSIYEEIPEDFLDETDVDSYFYHSILDISQSHHRNVRVSKGSNKKSFAFKVFHFCDSKLQQRFILEEEVSIFKKANKSLLDSLGEFLKAFDQANKVSQIPLPKPKFEIGFTKAKDEVFTHCYKDIAEHLNRQIRLSFRFENWKEQDLRFLHQKVWTLRWSIHSYRSCQPGLPRNQTSLQASIFCCLQVWHFWEQLQCAAHSLPIVGMIIALLYSLETCIVQIQSVWVNFACTKSLFNLWAQAIINVRKVRLCVRCAIFLLKNKQTPFSCRLVKVFTFLKRTKDQFKMLLELCIVPVSMVSTERNANLLVAMWQLREPFMVVENVEPSCLFTKFLSRYKNM